MSWDGGGGGEQCCRRGQSENLRLRELRKHVTDKRGEEEGKELEGRLREEGGGKREGDEGQGEDKRGGKERRK